ncbi:MAG: ABC transporter ATP-binding protein [Isosphaeraceae bacterium]
MNPAIRVESLSKRYRLGTGLGGGYQTLRDSIEWSVTRAFKALRRDPSDLGTSHKSKANEFWALSAVSFKVMPGDVVGVIGRNGAGKSTLLKVLSRITEPTAGRVEIRGRVGSLLEVGTGFHPELTGRENIYMNGSILGMTRREIGRRFDEIVAFAELERFLDTPVKRYSSGMYVRLAFAVAAHLEPEILIVDEVLAVGDTAFQKKCLGRIQQVGRSGRTVLFVSHNMAAVQNLCDRVVLLDQGQVAFEGETTQGISRYADMFTTSHEAEIDLSNHPGRLGHHRSSPILKSLRILGRTGEPSTQVPAGCPATFELIVGKPRANGPFHFGISIETSEGIQVARLNTMHVVTGALPIADEARVTCELESLPLTPDRYYLSINTWSHGECHDRLERAASFEVLSSDYLGNGMLPDRHEGFVLLKSRWDVATL